MLFLCIAPSLCCAFAVVTTFEPLLKFSDIALKPLSNLLWSLHIVEGETLCPGHQEVEHKSCEFTPPHSRSHVLWHMICSTRCVCLLEPCSLPCIVQRRGFHCVESWTPAGCLITNLCLVLSPGKFPWTTKSDVVQNRLIPLTVIRGLQRTNGVCAALMPLFAVRCRSKASVSRQQV